MEHVSCKVGIGVEGIQVTDLDYADDVTLPELLTNALEVMERDCAKFRLYVLWAKTAVQNLGAGPAICRVTVDRQNIDTVSEFTYLGQEFASYDNSVPECLRRIVLASRVMSDLEDVWRQQNLSLTTKLCANSASVMSVLLYDAENWTLIEQEWLKLQALHMNCQSRILAVKWHNIVTNESISAITVFTGLDDITDVVRRTSLGLFDHIARLGSNVPASSALTVCCASRDGRPPDST